MKIDKYDPTASVITAVTTIIKLATPRSSLRGKKDRDRIVREVIVACKGMMVDKRMKENKILPEMIL